MTSTAAEKHPRGLYVLFGTEMWERYSFYTVGAMLSLYLRDATEGFGFSNARSASVVSTYNMFIYFTPLLGGLIADRLTGFRKAIMVGGVSFMIGHALLAVPDSLFVCYLALTFLVIGNGFFKPNVSSMVGNLYREGSHLKDKAYLIFYMGINIGALLAPLVANFVRPRWGFHPAFFMGAIGMMLSLIVFGVNQKWVRHADRKQSQGGDQEAIAAIVDLPPTPAAVQMAAVPEWKRIMALIVIFLIVIVFWMVFHQNSISLTWWAEDHSRALPGILSFALNPFFIVILSTPFGGLLELVGQAEHGAVDADENDDRHDPHRCLVPDTLRRRERGWLRQAGLRSRAVKRHRNRRPDLTRSPRVPRHHRGASEAR